MSAALCGSSLGASAEKLADLQPLGRIVSCGTCAVEPDVFGIAPVEAANLALRRAGIGWEDVEVIELNEALASQCLADLSQWDGLDTEKLNPNGGATAIGHPLGASGRAHPRRAGARAHAQGRPLRRGGHLHRRGPGPRRRPGGLR